MLQRLDKVFHDRRQWPLFAVNDGQRLGAAAVCKRHRRQHPVGDFRPDDGFRQDRHARAHFHHALDHLRLVELVRGFKMMALVAGDAAQERRRADFRPGDKPLPGQPAKRDRLTGGKGMLRMADEHQPFVAEQVYGQGGPPPGITHQAKVDRAIQHRVMHAVNE